MARFLNHYPLGAVAEDFHDSLTVQSFEDLDLVSDKLLKLVLDKLESCQLTVLYFSQPVDFGSLPFAKAFFNLPLIVEDNFLLIKHY